MTEACLKARFKGSQRGLGRLRLSMTIKEWDYVRDAMSSAPFDRRPFSKAERLQNVKVQIGNFEAC